MNIIKEKYNTQRYNILAAARKLFYEQGYKHTYLEQIADICNITKPLILYHFNSKAQLAREVSEIYIDENKNNIAFKVYKYYYNLKRYDLQVSTAVEIYMMNKLNIQDEKVARFVKERSDDKYDEMFSKNSSPRYQIHDRRYKLNINRKADELTMISKAAPAAVYAIMHAYKNSELNCTLEECLEYCSALHFRLMHIDEERISEIIQHSRKVLDTIQFEIAPYFQII